MKPTFLGLDGLQLLTDETGMFQHSKFSTIDRREGYTTDDNARALIASLLHYHVYQRQEALRLSEIYLTFLLHMQRQDGRLHNLLGFDRKFKDDVGSEDCIGRTLWACGYLLSVNVPTSMKNVAKEIFDRGMLSTYNLTSPRSWAFTILGLHHYLQSFPDDLNLRQNIVVFADKLVKQYQLESNGRWRWFEPYLTYSNPRLPQALFSAYESTKKSIYQDVAQSTLNFLIETQIEDDVFVPIGTKGWFEKDGNRALYDQQPIEASCMVEAALVAQSYTGDRKYRETAQIAFDWFHGRNTKNVILYDDQNGTCYDGITSDGLNQNQGAEATLSYYIAYLKLKEKKASFS